MFNEIENEEVENDDPYVYADEEMAKLYSNEDNVENVENNCVSTRTGRKVKKPSYLQDYE